MLFNNIDNRKQRSFGLTLQNTFGGDPGMFEEAVDIDVSTALDIFNEDGDKALGFLLSSNWTCNRPVTPIRVLSSAIAGRILYAVPQPETNTLTVTGYSLYTTNTLDPNLLYHVMYRNAIPATPGVAKIHSLTGNYRPFTVREETTHPDPGATDRSIRTYYKRCLFTNFTKPRAIGTVIQADTATLHVQYVETVLTPVPPPVAEA